MRRYANLREAIVHAFAKSELVLLCHDLSVNPELIFSGNEVLDTCAQQLILYFEGRNRLPELLAALTTARPDKTWEKLYQSDRERRSQVACPYPGMLPFTDEGPFLFCGREAEIAEMVQRVQHQHFLLVIGSSGSGKSSLVRAGLLPRLAKTDAFPAGFWLARTIQPGAHPLQTLAECLGAPAEQTVECDRTCIAALLKANPPAQKLLLVVDQFEETFSQNSSAVQREFIAAIMSLCNREDCTVIVTMRADYYGQLMNSHLWALAEHQRMDVTALKNDALRSAIQTPAESAEVTVEPELVERLLADAEDQPGALPLIQETLVQLWQARQNDVITLDAYEAMGRDGRSGLSVAMETVANGAISGLAGRKLDQMAQHILLDLVQLGEPGFSLDTRRRQYESDLRAARNGTPNSEFDTTLNELTQKRLVVRGINSAYDPTPKAFVELSHDALLSGWQALKKWLDKDRDKLRLHRQLSQDVKNWTSHNFDEGLLYGGSKLKDAVSYGQAPLEPLLPNENNFLQKGKEMEAQRERTRYRGQMMGLAIGTGVGYGLAFALGVWVRVWNKLNEQPFARDIWTPLLTLLKYSGTTFLNMLAIGAVIGLITGVGLWQGRRSDTKRILFTGLLAGVAGVVVYPIFITLIQPIGFAGPEHILAGGILGTSMGLCVSLTHTKTQRLIVMPLVGMGAALFVAVFAKQISPNLLVAAIAGLLLGGMTAMGFQATAVPLNER